MPRREEPGDDRPAKQEAAAASIGSFNAQYDDYQAELRTIGENSSAARRDAAAAYREKVSAAVAEAYAPAREAYVKYMNAFFGAEASGAIGPDPELARAEFEYREADHRAAEAASRACEDEWQAYCDQITTIDQQDATRWKTAFVAYFDRLKGSIAGLDPVDPRDVQVLAETLSLACVSALSASSA